MNVGRAESYSDHLIRFAFSDNPENNTRVKALGRDLGRLVVESWDAEDCYAPDTLRIAKVVACLPSLETVARSKTHTRPVAKRVTVNFHDLAERILYTPSLEPYALKDVDEEGRTFRETKGQLSEIGL